MSLNRDKDAEEATVSRDLEEFTWPTAAADTDARIALDDLLISLQLMATDAARAQAAKNSGWWTKTPPSMQVIRSGTQALSKWWIAITAGVGGVGGLATAVGTWIAAATKTIGTPVAIALIGSAALVLSATAIALALFVQADLDSRGVATAARNTGRAEVAAAFLHATAALPTAPRPLSDDSLLRLLAAFPNRVKVATSREPVPRLVTNVGQSPDGQVEVQVKDGSWIEIDRITGYTTA